MANLENNFWKSFFFNPSLYSFLKWMNFHELVISVLVDTPFHYLAENSTQRGTGSTGFFLLSSPAQNWSSVWFTATELMGFWATGCESVPCGTVWPRHPLWTSCHWELKLNLALLDTFLHVWRCQESDWKEKKKAVIRIFCLFLMKEPKSDSLKQIEGLNSINSTGFSGLVVFLIECKQWSLRWWLNANVF